MICDQETPPPGFPIETRACFISSSLLDGMVYVYTGRVHVRAHVALCTCPLCCFVYMSVWMLCVFRCLVRYKVCSLKRRYYHYMMTYLVPNGIDSMGM